jgi:serine/threonine-protein kinase
LDFAHDRQILHRDVKPANILVRSDGFAKLTDFGIAKISSITGITRSGTVLGTLHYMPPEILKTETADHRADQYSLAVVAYEALAGCKPFDAPTPAGLMKKVLFDPPAPLEQSAPALPRAAGAVLERALAKNPQDCTVKRPGNYCGACWPKRNCG